MRTLTCRDRRDEGNAASWMKTLSRWVHVPAVIIA